MHVFILAMASDISNIVAQLKQAVLMLMNPTTSNADRLAAFKVFSLLSPIVFHTIRLLLYAL